MDMTEKKQINILSEQEKRVVYGGVNESATGEAVAGPRAVDGGTGGK